MTATPESEPHRHEHPASGPSHDARDPAVAPASAAVWSASVLENVPIARDTYRLRLAAPGLAKFIRPGQFAMVRPGPEGASDPLLGRPFALYDVVLDGAGEPAAVDLVYLVVGRGTGALAGRRPGERLSVWGPLGNGFGAPPRGDVVFVAGGLGQTPFLALGRWWMGRMAYGGERIARPISAAPLMLYGVRSEPLLAGLDDFRSAGIAVEVATDDGSAGHHGYVTDLLAARLERGPLPARVIGCGPAPMLAALSRLTSKYEVPCEVSLENHMACGFGACFSCVAPIRQPNGSADLRRVCVEGPIFPADAVDWSGMHGQ
ncbi:Dihydroorotate dehydrogenase B (NAD(+)), electron transfer subunit [Aquisphaera giovannonii]|uniref:Dihydroorotate dehydrogenase B (NAD(+)), electron transfer subunit n=1 Tax=Aquisphaera giovannonii TaxID=406548 RepID=A0A5B9W2I9_9BACT|nr:dihydroorotate dehydrogenase electron transfer subunit [Aquisphaera giovannonii]QEH34796.1 Dihydroorotate dehydrogenase B (NAD(+)), electron transfer subunit [Aquisphaera giovannonii]